MEPISVAVVGAGYWGPNLIRTFRSLESCSLVAVCDSSPERQAFVRERFPDLPVVSDFARLISDPTLQAVAIATPVATHRPLAEQALAAGKHVFVEKPLAGTVDDAQALVAIAERGNRVLATGHVFVHHPAVKYLAEALHRGDLGRLCYVETGRVNPGPPNPQVDVVWDLGVHDVSIMLALAGGPPSRVRAVGGQYAHGSLTDVAFATLEFPEGPVGQVQVSWLSSIKTRRLFAVGTEGSALFDDTLPQRKLTFAGRGVDTRTAPGAGRSGDLRYDTGPVVTPDLPDVLPLTAECADFVNAIVRGGRPQVDGRSGLEVVRVLAAISESILHDDITVAVTT